MRFKAQIQNILTFTSKGNIHSFHGGTDMKSGFTASLEALGPYAWVRLGGSEVHFTVIPEQGTQVWA